MGIKSTTMMAAAVALMGLPAAAAVVQSSTRVMTEDGQRLGFEFHNIEQYIGTDAYFTVSTGSASTGAADGSDSGIDLDGEGQGGRFEYMAASIIGGPFFGRYSCGGRGDDISGHSMNGAADCEFSMRFDVSAGDFAELAMGGLEFLLNFGSGVGAFGDGDEITVSLNVDGVVPPIANAPLPASALLLLGGLGAAGFASRRRKNKS